MSTVNGSLPFQQRGPPKEDSKSSKSAGRIQRQPPREGSQELIRALYKRISTLEQENARLKLDPKTYEEFYPGSLKSPPLLKPPRKFIKREETATSNMLLKRAEENQKRLEETNQKLEERALNLIAYIQELEAELEEDETERTKKLKKNNQNLARIVDQLKKSVREQDLELSQHNHLDSLVLKKNELKENKSAQPEKGNKALSLKIKDLKALNIKLKKKLQTMSTAHLEERLKLIERMLKQKEDAEKRARQTQLELQKLYEKLKPHEKYRWETKEE